MRCDCNGKFVSLETGDPEEQNLDLSDGTITAEVRVPRTCAECGDEKKEYTFTFDQSVQDEIEEHVRMHHPDLKEDEEPNMTVEGSYSVDECGGGRYKKNVFTLTAEFIVTCASCTGSDDKQIYSETLTEECAASDFEEM